MSEKPVPSDIHSVLSTLHNELQSVTAVDQVTKQHLIEIVADIQKVLAAENEPVESQLISDRLEAAALKFEQSHPVLTAIVQKAAESLASLGI